MPIPLGTKVNEVRPARGGETIINGSGKVVLVWRGTDEHWPILAPDNAYPGGVLDLKAYLAQAQPGRELAEFRDPNFSAVEEYVGLDGKIYWTAGPEAQTGRHSRPEDLRRIILKPLPKPKKRVLVIEMDAPEGISELSLHSVRFVNKSCEWQSCHTGESNLRSRIEERDA